MTNEDRLAQRRRAGRWLRDQRERRGFTSAAEFGRAIEATKEVVWSYETGRSSVPDDRAEKIAEALGMDIIEVRRGLGLWVPPEPAGETSTRPPEADPWLTPEEEQLVEKIRRDPVKSRRLLDTILAGYGLAPRSTETPPDEDPDQHLSA